MTKFVVIFWNREKLSILVTLYSPPYFVTEMAVGVKGKQ